MDAKLKDHFDAIEGQEFIYFIGSGDYVKIGFTRSVYWRFRDFITNTPALEILLIQPGTLRQEKIFHRHFQELRAQGEWFRKTPELLAFIRQRHSLVHPDLPLPKILAELP